MTNVRDSAALGVQGSGLATVGIDLPAVNQRVKGLAVAQSADIRARLVGEGVRVVAGQGRLSDERSEEHTSELQSRQYLVCRLLLEKKKTTFLVSLKIAPQDRT